MALGNTGGFHAWFRGISAFTVFAAFALVIIGGIVRVTGSGLGCPDWPGCDGGIFPPWETKALIEYSHRITASFVVGPLILFLFISAWVRYRRELWVLIPATLAFVLVIAQAALGGATVLTELPGATVMAHLAVAEALVACLVVLAVVAYRGPLLLEKPEWASGKTGKFPTLAVIAGVAVFLLILSGSYVTITGSTGACFEWPLCQGDVFPTHRLQLIHMFHRYIAGIVGLFVLYSLHLGFRGRTQPTEIRVFSMAAVTLIIAQVVAGAWAVQSDFSQESRALHLALATGVWITVSGLVVLIFSNPGIRWAEDLMAEHVEAGLPTHENHGGLIALGKDYLTLTKPPIIILLVITAIGGMFLAAEGVPSLQTLALVCIGGALGAGGANAINHFLDQDIDAVMSRTVKRPVASNRIAPIHALIFGIALNVGSFLILTYGVNLLSACLTMSATLFYVLIYTGWLKRNTPQNIVIGGAAGAIPPMVGWTAVTGSVDLPAVYLFTIIFFWTPPHFWALALMIKDDYQAAGIPMLPVVMGVERTVQNIFTYSLALVALTLVFATTDAVGLIYLASTAVLGAVFILMAWNLKKDQTTKKAKHLYLYSLLYLALLFAVMLADAVFRF